MLPLQVEFVQVLVMLTREKENQQDQRQVEAAIVRCPCLH